MTYKQGLIDETERQQISDLRKAIAEVAECLEPNVFEMQLVDEAMESAIAEWKTLQAMCLAEENEYEEEEE